ncbi:MAG: NUDIX domain-containing protein [Cytophagaceae bacterium]|nr:NUDIX domain-containing protein [Cytophagaceae bacterium]MDW8456820.1 NUDIX domain-containing protein [Cytophagaceae bacterium]
MKIFINDRPVSIVPFLGYEVKDGFDTVLTGEDEITSKRLIGDVLVQNATTLQIERVLRLLEFKKLKKLKSLSFAVRDVKVVKEFIKDQFKIIKASGGLVRKGDKILMIYRLKKWDLPKGKLNKGEDPLKGAKREVEEECNIRVDVREKLCSTWHTYIRKDKRILKKTNWYVMDCADDSNMKPQLEEFIEEVKWQTKENVMKCLKNSYLSIQEVFKEYYSSQPLNSIR